MPPLPKDKRPLFEVFGNKHPRDISGLIVVRWHRVKPDFDDGEVINAHDVGAGHHWTLKSAMHSRPQYQPLSFLPGEAAGSGVTNGVLC
jgi:hypothetical protein